MNEEDEITHISTGPIASPTGPIPSPTAAEGSTDQSIRPEDFDYSEICNLLDEECHHFKDLVPGMAHDFVAEQHWWLPYANDEKDQPTYQNFKSALVEGFEAKRLFICCDGTWQNASGTVSPMSNVAKLTRAVDRLGKDEYTRPEIRYQKPDVANNPDKRRYGLVRQVVYYSSGVGAQSALSIDSGFSGATGKGLTSNILSAYCFICNNYNFSSTQDEIILVGFSRGAFAVRCLASFISEVGLLRRRGLVFLHSLFTAWKKWGDKGMKQEGDAWAKFEAVKRALGSLSYHSVPIKVLAEWDTVSALGLPLGFWKENYSFVNRVVPSGVENAFFAFALDEKRRSFTPRLWRAKSNNLTKVEQCAFVGCHSDIGGGNVDVGLSTISLLWMISRITGCSGARFDKDTLLQFMTPLQHPRLRFLPDRNPEAGGNGRWSWPWVSQKTELKGFAATQGKIHESRTGWWLVAYVGTFTLWDRKRNRYLLKAADIQQSANDTPSADTGSYPCPLQVHITVRVLDNLKCRIRKSHNWNKENSRWEKLGQQAGQNTRTPPLNTSLSEATITSDEGQLLRDWIQRAKDQTDAHREYITKYMGNKALYDKNPSQHMAEARLKDVGDERVNWTEVAVNMGWVLSSCETSTRSIYHIMEGWV